MRVHIPSVLEANEGEALVVTSSGRMVAKSGGGQGPKGDKGDRGDAGAPGAPGTNGTNGATGPAGPAPSGTGFVRVTAGVLDPVVAFGSASGTICQGNDSRLSDARTPTAHTHAQSEVTNLVSALAGKAASSHTHAASDIVGGVGYMKGVSKDADQTGIGTNFVDVTGLTVAVLNGQRLRFRAMLRVTTNAAATAGYISCNGPTTSILTYKRVEWTAATTFTTTLVTAYDNTSANTAGPGATVVIYEIEGFAKFTADGTFAIRFKAESGGTGAVLEGSWMEYALS